MFECSGSFQLPSVRHTMPIMRSIHSLRAVDRRDGSLIVWHARAGASYWPSEFEVSLFRERRFMFPSYYKMNAKTAGPHITQWTQLGQVISTGCHTLTLPALDCAWWCTCIGAQRHVPLRSYSRHARLSLHSSFLFGTECSVDIALLDTSIILRFVR